MFVFLPREEVLVFQNFLKKNSSNIICLCFFKKVKVENNLSFIFFTFLKVDKGLLLLKIEVVEDREISLEF